MQIISFCKSPSLDFTISKGISNSVHPLEYSTLVQSSLDSASLRLAVSLFVNFLLFVKKLTTPRRLALPWPHDEGSDRVCISDIIVKKVLKHIRKIIIEKKKKK